MVRYTQPTTEEPTVTTTYTTETWTLGMPLWDTAELDSTSTAYCDLTTRTTVAQMDSEDWDGQEGWVRYTWTEAGECQTEATAGLWWMLDDLLWGPCYWERYWPDGREMTVAEDRAARGMPVDDLLYDLEMARVQARIRALRPTAEPGDWDTD